jgi:hypothetical protein
MPTSAVLLDLSTMG